MKHINYIINGILAIAVTVLFTFCSFSSKEHPDKTGTVFSGDSAFARLPVAYVYEDSLLNNFNFYTDLINKLELEIGTQRNQLKQRYQNLEKEVAEFQQKVQNNAFLTRERMEQEQSRLMRKQSDIEQAAAQAEQQLALKQKMAQQQISDTLSVAMKEFNTPQKYQLIFTRMGNQNILYADESYNITEDVIEFLNARFKVEK